MSMATVTYGPVDVSRRFGLVPNPFHELSLLGKKTSAMLKNSKAAGLEVTW